MDKWEENLIPNRKLRERMPISIKYTFDKLESVIVEYRNLYWALMSVSTKPPHSGNPVTPPTKPS
jgi:hypothetical protein